MRGKTGGVWLLAALGVLLWWSAGWYGVIETSDARYAEIAREMLVNGDWLHPSLLGIHHYHKPPVTYWLAALGMEWFGVNPFGARFFLQAALLLQLWLLFRLARTLGMARQGAFWTAGIYLSFWLVLASVRNLTTDAFLTTAELGAVYLWAAYRLRGGIWRLYLMAAVLGAGFMIKGPVTVVVPTMFMLACRQIGTPFRAGWHRWGAVALFTVTAGWWFVYLAYENPAFWSYFIEHQTVERFAKNVFHRHEPFWYYWLYVPLAGLPWLGLLPWLAYRQRRRGGVPTCAERLMVATAVAILFFSLSESKRILYVLPLYPLLALVLGMMLDRADETERRVVRLTARWFAVAVGAVLGAAFVYILPGAQKLLGAAVFGIGGALWYWLGRCGRPNAPVWGIASLSLVVMVAVSLAISWRPDLVRTPVAVAAWMKARHLENRPVLVYDRRLPSLAFHLRRPIISLYDGSRSLNRETQFETDDRWKTTLFNLKRLSEHRRLRAQLDGQPYVVVTYRKKIPPYRAWLLHPLRHSHRIGEWVIYY